MIKNKFKERLEIELNYTNNENEREITFKGSANGQILKMNYKIKKISGDASFREFYRIKKGLKSSIIVKANKEKQRNLINYIIINKVLNENKINAPKLINNYYENSIIEISDLGEKSFYNFIISKKNKLSHYKKLIKLIIKLQKLDLKTYIKLENIS